LGRQVVDESTRSSAPPAAIWPLLADTTTWSDWGDWSEAELVREGTPAPGGVHSVKRLKKFPVTTVEEVTVFEPERRLGYELRSGMPLRGYRAEVTLTPADGGGTEIRWHSEFEPKVPGTGRLYQRVLSRFMADAVKRLAAAAERR
jgi:uncharacterized protein YndB with AHSA1/START domain